MVDRRRQAPGPSRTVVAAVVAACLAVLVVGGVVVIRLRGDGNEVAGGPAVGATTYGVTLGDPDAPHRVVIYEDFLCPYCGELEAASADDLSGLAADGRVFVEYRPFWLLQSYDYSAQALNAWAAVLDASGPEVARSYHDLLFANQPSESGPFPGLDDLVDLAVEAGAERPEVADRILGMTETDFITSSTQQATSAGVQGTPWVVLDENRFAQGNSMDEIAANLVAAVS